MCGICGIVDYSGEPISEGTLRAMTETLSHRGPDDQGIYVRGAVGVGHRRLSILDLSAAGHQPMESKADGLVLVYNGELYNFPTLRSLLEQEGVAFSSSGDTEVLLKAFAQWGPATFSRFNGMFAFAVWEAKAKTLHLVRDRFGIKPLYYYRVGSGLVFGSEMKAILASGRVSRSLNWGALHEYLYYGNPLGENTFFEGLTELLPGHCLTLSPGGLRVSPYWSVENIQPVADDLAVATQTVRQRLDDAVAAHLISDVPVGVFLSGGIDSSAITALASKHYQGRLQTFSVGFDFDGGVHELDKARSVADRFQTDHHELHISGQEMPAVIEKLVRCHDEPFADAANIPLYLLCERLKGSVKVILQGDGGDEIFAGYRRYNALAHARFWRCVSAIASVLAPLCPKGPAYWRGMRFLQAMGHGDPAMRMALLMTQEARRDPPTRVLSAEAAQRLQSYDPFESYRGLQTKLAGLDTVQRMLYVDCVNLLPSQFLEKVDKSTMAHSIEVRVPFLDVALTEYAMGLPSDMKVRSFQKKWILRRALRGVVPDEILDGKKTGFGVPYQYWLREPMADYMRAVLLDPAVLRWGLFDEAQLCRCMDEHVDRRRDNGNLLYKLLNLALWSKYYLNAA
jgi:asparagine synthase (glutamine-hydrolysing)